MGTIAIGRRSGTKTNGAKTSAPTWIDAKATLASFDRAGLIGLLKDLHALNPQNRPFLQARLALGAAPLAPYKATNRALDLPGCDARPGHLDRQSKESDCRLPEGRAVWRKAWPNSRSTTASRRPICRLFAALTMTAISLRCCACMDKRFP